MNEGTLIGTKKLFEEVIAQATILLKEYDEVEARQKTQEETSRRIKQKELSLLSREYVIGEDKKDIERQKGIISKEMTLLEERKKEIETIDEQLNKKREEVKKEIIELNGKRVEMDKFEEEKKRLTILKEELYQKQSDIDKEMLILRTKKETLDITEQEINREKERIKSMIHTG